MNIFLIILERERKREKERENGERERKREKERERKREKERVCMWYVWDGEVSKLRILEKKKNGKRRKMGKG